MKNLYRMFVDYGRMGAVEGTFLASPEELKNLYGKTIYFGEILGKHSEIYFDLKPEHITLLTVDQEFIAKAVECDLVNSGYNPLEYYEEFNWEDEC